MLKLIHRAMSDNSDLDYKISDILLRVMVHNDNLMGNTNQQLLRKKITHIL